MYRFKRCVWGFFFCCLLLAGSTAAVSAAGAAAANAAPATADTTSSELTILGEPELTRAQMVRYIEQRNPQPLLNCSVEALVNYYYYEGALEGVRPDVAICQAIKETGCFAYGGDVAPQQNNFCGLGAVGHGAPGYSFVSPQRGVRAHIQHLVAYASGRLPRTSLADPRFTVLRDKYPQFYGQVPYWTGLNGKWAVPGTHYGQDIVAMWKSIKEN